MAGIAQDGAPLPTDHRPSPAPHGALRILAQVVLSLTLLAVMACWGLFSLLLAALRCDDGCSGDEAQYWGYTGQFVLTAVGLTLGVIAIVLGFTRHRHAFWWLLAGTVGVGLGWYGWLLNGSF